MVSTPSTLTLKECAERLGVHYMTVYRYVRLGMLPATKAGSEWRIDPKDLDQFLAGERPARGRGEAPWQDRFQQRLLAGDERGAWQVVDAAMAAGVDPPEVHLSIIGPALRRIGDEWAAGRLTVADEHRAVAIASRIVGRLGPRFVRRGRRRGRIVIGTPPGERHALVVEMAADLMRSTGHEVVDLGCDLPMEVFVEAARRSEPISAVVVSVTNSESVSPAGELLARLREATKAPLYLGGHAIGSGAIARKAGGDDGGPEGRRLLELIAAETAHD